nr:galactokinase [Chloroflexota bacterium]
MTADREAFLRASAARFGRPATLIAEAPGRVNLIGEHTDYNEGHVLPLAIDRTVAVAASLRDDPLVRAISLDLGEDDEFALDHTPPAPGGGWRNYVRGVVWALGQAGHALRGVDLVISGDVPIGAGLSSSAALEVATAGALATASDVRLQPRELALLAQRAENDFAGVQCGVMDQFAAALGRREHALLIDCRSLAAEHIPLGLPEAGVAIVVVDSGMRRSLEAAPYNLRRQECARAACLLGVAALRDAGAADLESHRGTLPEDLYRRARHVVTEEERVLAAVAALRGRDIDALGDLLYASHRSLRDDFEVSCPELDLLVELARGTDGVLGARLTGAGFGGCTVNLVRRQALGAFEEHVGGEYRRRVGRLATVYLCQATDGLEVSYV